MFTNLRGLESNVNIFRFEEVSTSQIRPSIVLCVHSLKCNLICIFIDCVVGVRGCKSRVQGAFWLLSYNIRLERKFWLIQFMPISSFFFKLDRNLSLQSVFFGGEQAGTFRYLTVTISRMLLTL